MVSAGRLGGEKTLCQLRAAVSSRRGRCGSRSPHCTGSAEQEVKEQSQNTKN